MSLQLNSKYALNRFRQEEFQNRSKPNVGQNERLSRKDYSYSKNTY
jgi:hypothetical protein